jgi:hypothetical protein
MPALDLKLTDLSQEALDRLERRAFANGRSLTDEVNFVLASAVELTLPLPNIALADAINSIVADAGITEKDWQYFNRSLEAVRFSRSDRIQDEPIFGDWYDDFEDDEAVPAK